MGGGCPFTDNVAVDIVDIVVDVVLPGPVRPGQPHQESWCEVVGVENL